MDSYGYVETFGLVAAIEAGDAALKAADVTLTNCYIVRGGIVTVEISGDVAAVTAAVEAAAESARRLGNFLRSNIIARVDPETKKILVKDVKREAVKEEKSEGVHESGTVIQEVTEEGTEELKEEVQEVAETPQEEAEVTEVTEITEVKIAEEVKTAENDENNPEEENLEKTLKESNEIKEISAVEKKLRKQYQDMKVVDLKIKVNNLKLDYTWNQIKGMTKKKLIEILLKHNNNNN